MEPPNVARAARMGIGHTGGAGLGLPPLKALAMAWAFWLVRCAGIVLGGGLHRVFSCSLRLLATRPTRGKIGKTG
jgi:hypothetical protein